MPAGPELQNRSCINSPQNELLQDFKRVGLSQNLPPQCPPPTWSDLATVPNWNKGVSASRQVIFVANMGKKGRIWENGKFPEEGNRPDTRKLGSKSSCVTVVSLVAIQRKISTASLPWDLCDTDTGMARKCPAAVQCNTTCPSSKSFIETLANQLCLKPED